MASLATVALSSRGPIMCLLLSSIGKLKVFLSLNTTWMARPSLSANLVCWGKDCCQLARQLDWSPRAPGAQPSGLPAALTGPPSSRHSGRVSEKSWSGSVTLPHHWISTGTSANPGLVLSFKGALKECVGTRKIVKLNTCVQDSYCLF